MPSTNRRTLLRNSAICVGAGVVCGRVEAREGRSNPAGVGGYDYRLPAFKKGSRLLFQGDSITDMKWGRNQRDRNHYLGHSYVYLIASRLGVDMPEAKLEFFNRGMSGHKVADLKKRWQKDAIDMKPDLLSILIGVNDVGRSGPEGVPLDTWETDYRTILDASRKANADLRLVLLDPFVLPSGRLSDKKQWRSWRPKVDKLIAVVARLAKDYRAIHIKTQEIFDAAAKAVDPAHWIWDGVHPLPQGHELIARNWLQQVSATDNR
jgi:lysophospholipase L1-like esterase